MGDIAETVSASTSFDRIVDASWWGAHGTPHDILAELRDHHPVWRYEGGVVDPFWLITRHADIERISKDPGLWSSVPRTVLDAKRGAPKRLRSIVHMDPPEHTRYRAVMQAWLSPKVLRQLEQSAREISKELVDEMARTGRCDFVSAVSSIQPLRVLCGMLGIARDSEPEVLRVTRSLFAAHDPDYGAAGSHTNESAMLDFCRRIADERKLAPSDDLASALIKAEIDGQPMGRFEVLSNLAVILSAGHDTTASAMSGGLLALIRHPDQLAKLQGDMKLIGSAIEEFIRWATPTTNFVRTATRDTELHGVAIEAGDDVCIHYSAANRDDRIFAHPYEFQIDRKPNRHLGFGVGTHGCIGQMLARMEMKSLFEELIPRIESIELADDPVFIAAYWISGLKRLPISYRLR